MPEMLDYEDKDLRATKFKEEEKLEARKKYLNPYMISFTFFFSILILFIIMILIIVFVFLQQVFSNVGGLYKG